MLCPGVESVAVVVLLAGVCGRGGGRRAVARARGLGQLRGATGLPRAMPLVMLALLPLAKALGAADGPRPVQIGAHVTRPLAGERLGDVGDAHTGTGAGVRAD